MKWFLACTQPLSNNPSPVSSLSNNLWFMFIHWIMDPFIPICWAWNHLYSLSSNNSRLPSTEDHSTSCHIVAVALLQVIMKSPRHSITLYWREINVHSATSALSTTNWLCDNLESRNSPKDPSVLMNFAMLPLLSDLTTLLLYDTTLCNSAQHCWTMMPHFIYTQSWRNRVRCVNLNIAHEVWEETTKLILACQVRD